MRTAFLLLLILAACTQPAHDNTIVASFYPIAFFAQDIAGDTLPVRNIVPAGVGLHDWEPTPQDVAAIEQSRLFIHLGVGEFWTEHLLENLPPERVVSASEGIELLPADEEYEEDEHEEDHGEHDHGEFDPHIWLDPKLAQLQVIIIRDALIRTAPEHETLYRTNADVLITKLQQLDNDYTQGLANCTNNIILTNHNAFRYLLKRHNIKGISATGLYHEAEPSAQQLAELVDIAREHNITHIFSETLLSPRLTQTIAQELDGTILALNPIEGLTDEELAAGDTYFTIMRENLNNLRLALNCS